MWRFFSKHRQEGNIVSDNVNHVMNGLRRLNRKFDESGMQMADFLKRQAAGEKPLKTVHQKTK
jgi:hypothetical protein